MSTPNKPKAEKFEIVDSPAKAPAPNADLQKRLSVQLKPSKSVDDKLNEAEARRKKLEEERLAELAAEKAKAEAVKARKASQGDQQPPAP